MGNFAAFVHHGKLHPVSLFKELLGVLNLDFQVVFSNLEAKPDFFQIVRMRFLSRLLLFFLFVIDMFAVVHDAAYGWLRFGSDFNQIQFLLCGLHSGLVRQHNPKLSTIPADHSDGLGFDFRIDP